MESTARSSTHTHCKDFNHSLELKEYDKVAKHENAVKPIGMFFCDGGSDENPRFPKNIGCCHTAF